MFETIRNAFKIKDVRRKIFMTILFIVLFRIGCYIQIPGLNGLGDALESNSMNIFGLLNSITGSALSQGTLFSLGISPYINASIIVQLLTVAIPALERMSKEGEEGREKINKITRWVTLALAIVSAVGVYLTLSRNTEYNYVNYSWLGGQYASFFQETGGKWIMGIYIVTVLVGGSMLCMWIGERITEYGVSNGISMIIFVGIISTAAHQLFNTIAGAVQGTTSNWYIALIFIVGLVLVFGFIVWVDGAERKIKVQYAKQVKGNKMYGGQSTFIPIKVNASGVMPLIFAYALMSFPTMLIQTFWANSDFAAWWSEYMTASNTGTNGWVGVIVYNVILAILIFVFAYFYSQIQFNPVEISRNIQNNGGFVTGIRPGRETAEYLAKVVSRITLWGAVFLAIIAFVPSIMFSIPGWAGLGENIQLVNSMSATGMLICVSVALEFNKALENQILMRHYKGLLGSNSKGFLK
ncbi:MAG: preprotein translocase subunit SecY [Clostridiales bacterium]|nr:preprotein translocase subunit SecY [Clostridiales bacterium]